MKNKNISFKLVAYTDAAGKYSPNAFREGNEDNFYVNENLADSTAPHVPQDEIIQLGEFGMLMVVADGMGGMNAGEVASQIAIDTIKNAFDHSMLTNNITISTESRQKYLEQTIKKADKSIKSAARKDKSREGMGSTIILGWIYNSELIISWCGDSRAYIYNDKSGIRLISRDHSYVQELVNKNILTYDQTFDHPQNNIITRSLGDPTKDAQPESKVVNIGKDDIILLCSDGLSGVLRDRKSYDSAGNQYPEENLEDIIRAHTNSMKECREALWAAAERGGWYDNVTAILCQIVEGPESKWTKAPIAAKQSTVKRSSKKMWQSFLLFFIFIAAVTIAFFIGKSTNAGNNERIKTDSLQISQLDSVQANDSIKTKHKVLGSPSKHPKKINEEQVKQQKDKDSTSSKHKELTRIIKGNQDSINKKFPPIPKKQKKPNNPTEITQ